jgi:predicted transposase YdaD
MTNPHDSFARFTFGDPERAAAELRAVLHPSIVAQVDWSTLKREPDFQVDAELRESESGLLFSARLRTGESLLFLMLLKNQSTREDRWMALRLLRYVTEVLESWRRAHPECTLLPIPVSLVVYFGPDGTWSAPRRVEELFNV